MIIKYGRVFERLLLFRKRQPCVTFFNMWGAEHQYRDGSRMKKRRRLERWVWQSIGAMVVGVMIVWMTQMGDVERRWAFGHMWTNPLPMHHMPWARAWATTMGWTTENAKPVFVSIPSAIQQRGTIVALADGVIMERTQRAGCMTLTVYHGQGRLMFYGPFQTLLIGQSTWIRAGQRLGIVGLDTSSCAPGAFDE